MRNDGVNYLLKMRDDVLDFNMLFSAQFFNFSDKNCDPFLIQTSILPKKNLAAGSGIRSIQQRKNVNEKSSKITIPLNDTIIQKAKACQEMIMYERVEQKTLNEELVVAMNNEVQMKFLTAINSNQPPPSSQGGYNVPETMTSIDSFPAAPIKNQDSEPISINTVPAAS